MSYLRVPGKGEQQVLEIFGSGGGEKIAKAFGLPLLGKIPLHQAIREGGDSGRPVSLDREHEVARIFDDIAASMLDHVSSKA
jgi:ATP-binding protein involved in chromosome partitioning